LAAFAGVIVALLERALGLDFLIDPWNPRVVLLPFLLFIMLVWSVLCDDLLWLPVAVAVGSYIVQTHVGYLPMIGGLLVLAFGRTVVVAIGDTRASPESPATARRRVAPSTRLLWTAVALLVGLNLWMPAIAQQAIQDPANLTELASYARDPGEPTLGWSDAFGEMGAQVNPIGSWLTGRTPVLAERTVAIPALLFLAAMAALGIRNRRRGDGDAAWLAAVVLLAVVLGLVSASRITGGPWFYVVWWWWVLGASVMLGLVWLTWLALTARRHRAPDKIVRVCVAATLVVTLLTLSNLPALVPDDRMSVALNSLVDQAAPALDRTHRFIVRALPQEHGIFIGGLERGVFNSLEERGFSVFVDEMQLGDSQYGPWRIAGPGDVDDIITLIPSVGTRRSYAPPEGSRLVATYDPLSPDERVRAGALEESIRTSAGGAAPLGPVIVTEAAERDRLVQAGAARGEVDELLAFQQRGDAFYLFLAPTRSRSAR
jgi:hypothetical protein